MGTEDTLYRAGEIARSIALIHNTVNGPALATYQSERDSVEFYLYDGHGNRTHHFRFGHASDYSIREVFEGNRGMVVHRTNQAERALDHWVHFLHAYTF